MPGASKQAGIAVEVEKVLAKVSKNVPALMLLASLEEAAGKNAEPTYLEILKIPPQL